MNVLMVCHAGVGLGLGHLTRSLVVAKALQLNFDACVQFIIQGEAFTQSDLEQFNYRFISLEQNISLIIESISEIDALNIVLLDLHPKYVPENFGAMLTNIRTSGCKIVAIDGLLEYRSVLDLIFIPSFQFTPPANLDDGAPIIFGWDCFLLNVQGESVDWTSGPNVLALTGGSDATELGETWPIILDQILSDGTELHWVTGPFSRPPRVPISPRINIHNHESPNGLGCLMQASNYAITVFGVSFFELLFYGIPTIVFSPYGGKDDLQLKEIAKAGIAMVARNEVDATNMLVDLMSNESYSRKMSRNSREILNTLGSTKLCHEISALFDI